MNVSHNQMVSITFVFQHFVAFNFDLNYGIGVSKVNSQSLH